MQVFFTDAFERQLKRLSRRYRSIEQDLKPLIAALLEGETPGDQIQGLTEIVFKARVSNSSAARGKRGGYRVIYAITSNDARILVAIYSKTEQGDISSLMLKDFLRSEDAM